MENVYACSMCGYEHDNYDDSFASLPEDWVCPMCGAPKGLFEVK